MPSRDQVKGLLRTALVCSIVVFALLIFTSSLTIEQKQAATPFILIVAVIIGAASESVLKVRRKSAPVPLQENADE